jgi:hypothetical protein
VSAIRHGHLSELFAGVVAKRLTLVETVTERSNQHEFQGTKPFRDLFGTEDRRRIHTKFIRIAEEQDALAEDGFISWSNVRKGKPRPPEFHLYYSGNSVTEMMRPGDTVFVALRRNGDAVVIVAPAETSMQRLLRWLFGLPLQDELLETFSDLGNNRAAQLDFVARFILDELGIEFEESATDVLDSLIERFGLEFPDTRTFSSLARSSLPEVDARDDPDAAIVAWMEREAQMFRRLERLIVDARLRSGFVSNGQGDVEGFLRFSLSVQNRRKSRAGMALENHLEAMFRAFDLRFERGRMTENRNTVDFLFPGEADYRDPLFPASRLTMLGSKASLKDRWRQVLSEAARIETKHLVTLEPGISTNQTDEMRAKRLQLVVPAEVHRTYTGEQRSWLMDVRSFVALVRDRQAA